MTKICNCRYCYNADECWLLMPDSKRKCTGKCPAYEEKEEMTQTMEMEHTIIEGVGKDAEIITNEKGGKQSKSPMAMHLVDPIFLHDWADDKAQMYEYCDEGDSTCVDAEDRPLHDLYRAICYIADFMTSGVKFSLFCAIDFIEENANQQIIKIAKVLQYGAGRYAPNNWRLIPEEEHINHALIHLMAALEGDTQDDHLDHALCRLMMAISTEKSPNFEYGKYVDEVSV